MFPYPSGNGLHVGHPEGYTATDILARMKRMQGYNVLHPMGWDAFGLPAEQFAIQTGNHPAEFTKKNVDHFREQIQSLGFSYDWDREISTTDPDYYKSVSYTHLDVYKRQVLFRKYSTLCFACAMSISKPLTCLIPSFWASKQKRVRIGL